MKKSLSKLVVMVMVSAVLCAALTINCAAQWKLEVWNRVPDEEKAEITLYDWEDQPILNAMFFAGTKQACDAFLGEDASDMVNFFDTYFSHHNFLIVAISTGGTSQLWYPWQIAFTQGWEQFDVGPLGNKYSKKLGMSVLLVEEGYLPPMPLYDYISMAGDFGGGVLKPYTVAWGAIRIPDGIDLSQPFKIWIGDNSGTIKAFYGRKK